MLKIGDIVTNYCKCAKCAEQGWYKQIGKIVDYSGDEGFRLFSVKLLSKSYEVIKGIPEEDLKLVKTNRNGANS